MTPADTPITPTITVTTGPAAGRSVQIDGEVIIGREGADLTIADAELSRRHAVLRATSAGVVIEDLGSLNGTFVNNQRISVATALSADDGIRVGASWLKLVLPAPPQPPSSPDPAPIVDTETTRQRPIPTTPDPTPIVDTETTRQRPVPAPASSEGTVVRQAPPMHGEHTTVRSVATEGTEPAPVDAVPPEAAPPPPPGGASGLPPSIVTIIALVVIAVAIGIVLASNLKSSKSTHPVSARINATLLRAPQLGQAELAGTQQGGILGTGPTTIDEFLSTPGASGTTGSQLLSARITSHLPAGTLTTVVKASMTPGAGGGASIAGTATITGGTSRYKHATGTYSVTGTQAASSGATILTLRGSISY